MRKKPSKRNREQCFICKGTGRLNVVKDSGIKDHKIQIEERCQICNGTGVQNYE